MRLICAEDLAIQIRIEPYMLHEQAAGKFRHIVARWRVFALLSEPALRPCLDGSTPGRRSALQLKGLLQQASAWLIEVAQYRFGP